MAKITVTEGVLEGEIVQNEYGGSFYSFKGIPYAEPPVGDLRFKAPQPKKPWQGVRSAKEFGPECFQINFTISPEPFGSEDCLYLNVYTPDFKPSEPLPVMVWIHGGGFIWGSGNDNLYGPEFLIRHGVIIVTLNYRLEVLGFLTMDTEDIPGNAGMKDQVAALRWVKKNISSFGGDPENITIFGESAGAASVSYHLISPMTKGLFKRAIMQSGAATNWWSLPVEPKERALSLAKKLGCNSNDDKELHEFFKNQPSKNLVGAELPVTRADKEYEIYFGVVDEKEFGDNERFFYGDAIEALRTRMHDVDVIIGYNEDEGLMALAKPGNTREKFLEAANKYCDVFIPKPVAIHCNLNDQFAVARRMKKFYTNNSVVDDKNCDRLFKYVGMDMFVQGIFLQAKICSTKAKVYFYKFTCKSERNFMVHLLGLSKFAGNQAVACHADDLPYLFPAKIIPLKADKNSPTFELIERFTKLWTNFAKYGNPTPDTSLGIQWPTFSPEKQDYLEIGNEIAAKTYPDKEEIEFWEKIYKQFIPHWTD